MKRMLALAAAIAALSLIRRAWAGVAAGHARRDVQESKEELRRWEDEGGSITAAPPGSSSASDATR